MNGSSRSRTRCIAVVLCTATLLVAPMSRAAAQDVQPFAAYSRSAQTLRDSIVALARAQIGTRYRWGGESPGKGFDCSGLVQYVMKALNLDLPRTARLQAKVGLAMPRDTSELLPGDLLTFGKSRKGAVSHVAIYVGNGRYIHASPMAGMVIESSIDRTSSPLIRIWRGARRILDGDDSTAALAVAGKPPIE